MSSYSQSDIYHSIFSDIYTVFCGMQDCPPFLFLRAGSPELLPASSLSGGEKVYFYSGEERYPIKTGDRGFSHSSPVS